VARTSDSDYGLASARLLSQWFSFSVPRPYNIHDPCCPPCPPSGHHWTRNVSQGWAALDGQTRGDLPVFDLYEAPSATQLPLHYFKKLPSLTLNSLFRILSCFG